MQYNRRSKTRQHWLSSLFGLLICVSLLLSSVAAAPMPASAQAAPQPASDPGRANYQHLIIKMKAGAGAMSVTEAAGLPELDLQPMFPAQPGEDSVSAQAAGVFGSYFHADLGPDVTVEAAQQTLDALLQNPAVETAYMAPILLPASNLLATPDSYVAQQGYLDQMNVPLSGGPAGSKGANVTLVDIEGGWQIGHEDLPVSSDNLIPGSVNGSEPAWVNHGTAVLGIIAGLENSYGITGIAPDAYIRMNSTLGYISVSQAIYATLPHLKAGDIILLPLQGLGPRASTTCPDGCECANFEAVPVEYWQDTFDAISAATSAGIIVIEAAGTGAVDLDADVYNGNFKRSKRDSGAIMVGAGDSETHSALCYANTGSRVDLQGWGENVVSTGYGDLYMDDEGNPQSYYTATFGGSSAASAMVAGAVASLQGVAKAHGYLLTAEQALDFLKTTGIPQGDGDDTGNAGHIGPFPNLEEAHKKISDGVELIAPLQNDTLYTLRPTFQWGAYLGATQYQLIVSNNSTFNPLEINITTGATEYTPSGNLSKGQHYWKVRPALNGVWQEWTSSYRTFNIVAGTIELPKITQGKPSHNALTGDLTPEFTWKAASTAVTGYELQLSVDPNFTGVAPIQIAGRETVSYSPAAALEYNSRYYWRIRSYVTTGGNTYFGPWSSRRAFYTVIDITGIDPFIESDIYESTLRPTFAWNAVPDARQYMVQISTSETKWSSPYIKATIKPNSDGVLATSWRPGSDLKRATTLFYRVVALGKYGWSVPSGIVTFETTNPPSTPSVKAPAHKTILSDFAAGVVFSWTRPSSWKTNPAESYEIQLATSNDYTEGLVELSFDGDPDVSTQYSDVVEGLAPETAYYWRIRAVGADGASNWSTTRVFYTTPPIPEGLDALADTLRPELNWERVDLARSYQVQIAKAIEDEDDPAKIFKGKNIIATEKFTISPPVITTTTLPRNRDLLFRVRAGGIYGYSAWSEPFGFTTPNSPNTPALNSPADGANINSFTPRLNWNDSTRISGNPDASAVGYQVQIVRDRAEFAKQTPETVLDVETEISEHTLAQDALPTAGTYYWRVRAVNEAGEYSVWSSSRSFTTPAMVSGVVMNALEDAELAGATLQFSSLGLQAQSSDDGSYTIRGLMPGSYIMTSTANGFIRQTVYFSVGYGTNLTRNFNLVPLPEDEQLRIVVNWNGSPSDLDAHLWLPPTNQAHLSKDNLGGIDEETIRAEVNLTNANGFGPEVITIGEPLFAGKYVYAVYLNGGADQFVNTRARVTVYKGTTFVRAFDVPSTGVGHWWKVFTLDGSTGTISTSGANFISDSYPASYK